MYSLTTMTHTVHITLAQSDDSFAIKHFLKRNKQSSVQQNEMVYLLWQQHELIGLVRLVPIDVQPTRESHSHHFWLRGLIVMPKKQRQGLGSKLMAAVHQQLESSYPNWLITTFPLKHLKDFYSELGYQSCDSNQLPKPINAIYQQAQRHNKGWLCMEKTFSAR